MPDDRPRVAAVVLAAGSSRRAAPVNKLLAAIDGEPMIRRVARAVLASRARPVLVVTGHEAEAVSAALSGLTVRCVHNADHAQGIGTSVACGVRALPEDADGALIVLGDMPGVSARLLDSLIEAFPGGDTDACVPVHDGVRGNPVLWSAIHFPALARLEGDHGARGLLEHLRRVKEVPAADRGVLRDVDTVADLDPAGGGAGW